ncbi:MAG: hypothetical protein J5I53_10090 [Bradyrhizobiaceae bacterium]|nr:hypothetical protein [Bradyrhizobiaceae bacterium]
MSDTKRRAAAFVMPRLDAENWSDQSYRDLAYRLVDEGVGGFGVFKGTLEQTALMIQELQMRAGDRLLFGADFEHGLPMRLTEGGIDMPKAMALGKLAPESTEAIAAAVAREVRALGVHWNWAPVADVNSDVRNPVINIRSFGEEPQNVADHVAAWVRGTQGEHIAACLKHAPGHGATSVDSHLSLPTINVSGERAARREFLPFRAGIEAGAASIMVGHVLAPFLDDKHPASVSSSVINGLIRDTWGFGGVVVSDALDMGAITTRFDPGQAATKAFKAGCDIVLMPADPLAAIDALKDLFDKGGVRDERVIASEERIRALTKLRRHWPRQTMINQQNHAMLALDAAARAIVEQGTSRLLPLTKYQQAAVFALVQDADVPAATQWCNYLAQATEMNIDFGFVNHEISADELQAFVEGTADADVVLFALFGAGRAFQGVLERMDGYHNIVATLRRDKPAIIIACGSPYGVESLGADLVLYTYSNTTPSLAASVLHLLGKQQSATEAP